MKRPYAVSATPTATNTAPNRRLPETRSSKSHSANAVSTTYPAAVAGTAKLTSLTDSKAMNPKNEIA